MEHHHETSVGLLAEEKVDPGSCVIKQQVSPPARQQKLSFRIIGYPLVN